MKTALKILISAFATLSILNCSKSDNSPPDIELTLTNSTFFGATFDYKASESIESMKLVWNDANGLIVEKVISNEVPEISINGLEQNRTYFFSLVGYIDNTEYRSNTVELKTTEPQLLIDKEIFSTSYTHEVVSVLKLNNGYLIGSQAYEQYANGTAIDIFFVNENYEKTWDFRINERESNWLNEIIQVNDDNFIAIFYSNTGYDFRMFALKFNNQGQILWTNHYDYEYSNNQKAWLNKLLDFKNKGDKIFALVEIDTTPYVSNDNFFVEYELDNDGNLINQKHINKDENNVSRNNPFYYSKNDTQYLCGRIRDSDVSLYVYDALIERYDKDFNPIWTRVMGDGGDDYFHLIKNENEKLATIGVNGHNNGFDGESKWVCLYDINGNLSWEYKQTKEAFIYGGRDFLFDKDSLICLFVDTYSPTVPLYHVTSVMKLNSDGSLIWSYKIGEDFNDNNFLGNKIFIDDNQDILIFGYKERKIWLNKFRLK